MKTRLMLVASAIMTVMTIASAAQARTLYWTGQAGTYGGYYACEGQAITDGLNGARRSCVNDYKIQSQACYDAPIVQTDYVDSYMYNDGWTTCSIKVTIQVP